MGARGEEECNEEGGRGEEEGDEEVRRMMTMRVTKRVGEVERRVTKG